MSTSTILPLGGVGSACGAAPTVPTGVALVVVYYTLPLNRAGSIPAVDGLARADRAGRLGNTWAVTRSRRPPRLRAAESLATSIPLYIAPFAVSHATMSAWDVDAL